MGTKGAGTDSMHYRTPDGELIGSIVPPVPCAKPCFAGVKRNRLFMTGSESLYSLYVKAVGSRRS